MIGQWDEIYDDGFLWWWCRMPNDRNDERSVATEVPQSGEDWKQKFTYFLEHLLTHDPEKIKLIVAEVERIAGSKKEEQL